MNNEEQKEKRNIQNRTAKNRKKRARRNTAKKSHIGIIIAVIIIVVAVILSLVGYKINEDKKLKLSQEQKQQEITSHYNTFVKTAEETDIYKLNNNRYEKVGKISPNEELSLEDINITYETEYFQISNFDKKYYIHYKDVTPIDNLSEVNTRYKNYIVFNKNIITKDTTNFYNEEGTIVYTLPESYELPIIVNKKDIYGVEFNDRLLYVKTEDVKESIKKTNTKESKASKVRTLAYHRIYDPKTETCDQVICHTESQFESHIKYLSENKYLTLTTQELSDFNTSKIGCLNHR